MVKRNVRMLAFALSAAMACGAVAPALADESAAPSTGEGPAAVETTGGEVAAEGTDAAEVDAASCEGAPGEPAADEKASMVIDATGGESTVGAGAEACEAGDGQRDGGAGDAGAAEDELACAEGAGAYADASRGEAADITGGDGSDVGDEADDLSGAGDSAAAGDAADTGAADATDAALVSLASADGGVSAAAVSAEGGTSAITAVASAEVTADEKKTGWRTEDGARVYYGEDGEKVSGEQVIDGSRYCFASDGTMLTGFVTTVGTSGSSVTRYYDPQTGEMLTGEINARVTVSGETDAAGSWYWADEADGSVALDRFVDLGSKTCYYGSDGRMRYGELNLTTTVSGDEDPAGSWYWADTFDGSVAIGEFAYVSTAGKTCYYGDDGTMEYGEINARVTISGDEDPAGSWYWADTFDGTVATDRFVDLGSKTCHYGSDGKMDYGEVNANDGWYWADTFDGSIATSTWQEVPTSSGQTKTCYYEADGQMAHGLTWVPATGAYVYFDLVTGARTTSVNWWEASGASRPNLREVADLSIEVSVASQQVYVKSGGTTIYAMVASTGVLNGVDDTPLGSYSVTGRGYSFYNYSEQMGARYYVQFLGDYLFHSVPTDIDGNYLAAEGAKLGQPASHGCVRLTVSDAKWFYEQVPDGTPVLIRW